MNEILKTLKEAELKPIWEYPNYLVPADMVEVQPMKTPDGKIYYVDFVTKSKPTDEGCIDRLLPWEKNY